MAEGGHLLVGGATSVATQSLIEIVRKTPGWSVTGLSRNPPKNPQSGVRYIATDMLDFESCRSAVGDTKFTHLVYAARASHKLYTHWKPYSLVDIEDVQPNMTMLRNFLTAAETTALKHVHCVFGGKWYGPHLGPYRTPAVESDPGHMPPNFYFDQQQFLIDHSENKSWSWSASRPGLISGVAVGPAPNFLSTIGVYAAICAHLGRPFDFPGKPNTYTSLLEMTDATQLAEAIFWMCRSPEAENQAFNVCNGDFYRWKYIWPKLADHFGLKMGDVRYFSLFQWMADKGPIWDQIVKKHDLQPLSIDQVASWGFADSQFSRDYDAISSMTKIRKAGFFGIVDTEDMILGQLAECRRRKILP